MSYTFKRKDKTSIFCPQSRDSLYVYITKMKITKLMIAFSLIVLGAWILIITN